MTRRSSFGVSVVTFSFGVMAGLVGAQPAARAYTVVFPDQSKIESFFGAAVTFDQGRASCVEMNGMSLLRLHSADGVAVFAKSQKLTCAQFDNMFAARGGKLTGVVVKEVTRLDRLNQVGRSCVRTVERDLEVKFDGVSEALFDGPVRASVSDSESRICPHSMF